ncbi:MAG TPA: hypothetical protein VHG28_22230, partial [Longimicrobiaceae bacterium]|nr:hypothetical protein [Longimicrobiaceae bacterium]
SFTDPQGNEWQVWGVIPGQYHSTSTASHLPEEMAGGWLCFQCDTEKRRLAPMPLDWSERSESDLWALCRDAVPVNRPLEPTTATF